MAQRTCSHAGHGLIQDVKQGGGLGVGAAGETQ